MFKKLNLWGNYSDVKTDTKTEIIMENKKTIIDIKGVITKENGEEFHEKEFDQLVDDFLELVEKRGYMFGGGFAHVTEKEYFMETTIIIKDDKPIRGSRHEHDSV